MTVQVTNNGFSTLASGINNSATTIALTSGEGARFPNPSSPDVFYATLIDTSNNLEIVKVTARSTDSLTVVRAQDNTSARAFSTGDRFELRPVAKLFEDIQAEARDLNGAELVLDADGDTSITADTDDQIDIKLAGADDFKFTANTFHSLSGSKVLIGGGSDRDVGGNGANIVQVEGLDFPTSSMSLTCNANGTTAPTFRFCKTRGTALGSNTVVQNNDELGVIVFAGADGTDVATQGAVIIAAVDGTPGGNDLPTRLTFQTTPDGAASTTERMRIGSTGEILLGKTSNNFGVAGGCFNDGGGKNGALELIASGTAVLALNRLSDDGNILVFHKDGSSGGRVETSASATTYVTSSDYRQKENVDYSWDATTRLKQLKPARFNFKIDDTNTLIDGFLAHEVSSIVPNAVSGAKDATIDVDVVKNASGEIISPITIDTSEKTWTEGKLSTTDKDGNTVDPIYASDTTWHENETVSNYQGIDHSKLVPLLVKTIQELEARITALEG